MTTFATDGTVGVHSTGSGAMAPYFPMAPTFSQNIDPSFMSRLGSAPGGGFPNIGLGDLGGMFNGNPVSISNKQSNQTISTTATLAVWPNKWDRRAFIDGDLLFALSAPSRTADTPTTAATAAIINSVFDLAEVRLTRMLTNNSLGNSEDAMVFMSDEIMRSMDTFHPVETYQGRSLAVLAARLWRMFGRKGQDMPGYVAENMVYRKCRVDTNSNVELRNTYAPTLPVGTKVYCVIKERTLPSEQVIGPLGEPLEVVGLQPKRAALQLTFTTKPPVRCSSVYGPQEDDIDYIRMDTPIRPANYVWKTDEFGRLYRQMVDEPFAVKENNSMIYVPLYTPGYCKHVFSVWEAPKASTEESIVRMATRSALAGTEISSGQIFRVVMW